MFFEVSFWKDTMKERVNVACMGGGGGAVFGPTSLERLALQ